MHPGIAQRWEILRDIVRRPWVRILLAIWAASGVWDLALSQWIPEQYSRELPKVYQVVAIATGLVSWQAWLLVGAVVAIAGAIEYAAKHKSHLTSLPSGSPTGVSDKSLIVPKKLKDLFDSNFPAFGKKHSIMTLSYDDLPAIQCVLHVHQDFDSGSEFVSLYIPNCGKTVDVCDYFSHNFRKHLEQLNNIHFNIRSPG
jgi:hypothetical protein